MALPALAEWDGELYADNSKRRGGGGRKALSMNKFSKIHEIMENIIYIMPNYNLKKKIQWTVGIWHKECSNRHM